MIHIRIKATNMDLTGAIKEYVEKRIGSLDRLVDPNDTSATADIEVGRTTTHHNSGGIFRAEINLHISGKYLRAEATSTDLYAAIDEAKDEMARVLRSNKGKMRDLWKRGNALVKDITRGFGDFGRRFGKKFKWRKK